MNDQLYREPEDAFVQSLNVHDLLPQKDPFIMVERLLHFDMSCVEVSFTVRQDSMLVERGRLSAAGLIENMAQSCALLIGYISKWILHCDIQIGYIGEVRNLQIRHLPQVGNVITTKVQVEEEVFGMRLATITTQSEGSLLASSTMKIAIK